MMISRTNLLPYRKIRRAELSKRFTLHAVMAATLAAIVVFVGYQHFSQLKSNQETRNQRLRDAIVVLDSQITEIKDLKDKIGRVLDRKGIIESLQSGRNSTVSLMNELALVLPEGVSLTEIKQTGQAVQIVGMASSEAKVAEMITNIGKSTVLESPKLGEIKLVNDKATGSGRSSFIMTFNQHVDVVDDQSKKKVGQ